MAEKAEWLVLSENTFLWTKDKEGLAYNTVSNNSFRFGNEGMIKDLVEQLLIFDNLYSVEITKDLQKDSTVKDFTRQLEFTGCGRLQEIKLSEPKPIAIPPLLKLQKSVEILQNSKILNLGDDVLLNLHSLNLQLIDSNGTNLDFNKLSEMLDSVGAARLTQVDVFGSHLFSYPQLQQLLIMLDALPALKTVCISMNEFSSWKEHFELLKREKYDMRILIDEGFCRKQLEDMIVLCKETGLSVEWEFSVVSEQGVDDVLGAVEQLELENMEIKPVYNGKNKKFFEDKIYLTEDDLKSPGLSKRHLFANQALNTNDFGKLTITADGNVYANCLQKPLGTIDEDIRNLVLYEMNTGISWRRIRNLKPCCDCVYQWLCPSPSDYELAIGKPNLCHVK